MGECIHALPALVDAKWHDPNIQIDWVIERHYAQIPKWHSCVNRVIPVDYYRWQRARVRNLFKQEFRAFRLLLKTQKYDAIIDAQGTLTSAMIAKMANGPAYGFKGRTFKGKLAAKFYKKSFNISPRLHEVTRIRQLFSRVLGYRMPDGMADFGLSHSSLFKNEPYHGSIVILPMSTWVNKRWPDSYWAKLIQLLQSNGHPVKIVWGTDAEKLRAKNLVQDLPGVELTPYLDIEGVAKLMAGAKAVVSVDMGFTQLVEALNIPMIALYGPTSPRLTGPQGRLQKALQANFPCAPCLSNRCTYAKQSEVFPACFTTIPPDLVWRELNSLIK